ncbi:MAG: hypothetical protein H3Z53_01075 [archaeon]|nr:hypothetical protein [archaeon]MCP8312955.1 hypothetical protein [archaeon]
MRNRSKAIAPVIIAVILIVAIVAAGVVVYFVVIAPKPGPGQGFQLTETNDFWDFANRVSYMKFKWTNYYGTGTDIFTITFDDKGTEEVDGFNCRKFEIEHDFEGYITEIVVWVLESDWTEVKKVTVDGVEVPAGPGQSYYIGGYVFLPYISFSTWGINWANVPLEVGTLTPIGSDSRWYGETYITSNKWLFTPTEAYEPDWEDVEIWVGQADGYFILTKFKLTEEDGTYLELELLELTMR